MKWQYRLDAAVVTKQVTLPIGLMLGSAEHLETLGQLLIDKAMEECKARGLPPLMANAGCLLWGRVELHQNLLTPFSPASEQTPSLLSLMTKQRPENGRTSSEPSPSARTDKAHQSPVPRSRSRRKAGGTSAGSE